MRSPVREGELLAGKYVVERVLGQGGMGVVVAARHVGLDERVAVKFLLPELLAGNDAVARFLREARATVRIKNEHIAKVTDVGQLESGAPYMVMEYLEGIDLAGLLQTQGVLPIDDAVDFVIQACEAVADAHVLGIVHRDLKPSNLMRVLRSDGSPCIKVLDFGISKVTSQDGAMNMTATSAVLGSPLYMSPEQMMASRDVDERADIWSLGVILYELLSGKTPFTAESPIGLGMLIATERPAPVREARPDVPPALDAVIERCLRKGRDERFRNVAELVVALAPFSPPRSREPIERTVRIRQGGGATSHAAPTLPRVVDSNRSGVQTQTAPAVSDWRATGGTSSSRRNKTWVFVGAMSLAVAAAGVGLVAFVKPGLTSKPGAAASTPEAPPAVSTPPAPPPKMPVAETSATPISPSAEPAAATSAGAPAASDSAAKPNPVGAAQHRPPARSSPAAAPPRASTPPAAKPSSSAPKANYEDM